MRRGATRHLDPDLAKARGEERPVLGLLDGADRRTEDRHAVALEHALLARARPQFRAVCPPKLMAIPSGRSRSITRATNSGVTGRK